GCFQIQLSKNWLGTFKTSKGLIEKNTICLELHILVGVDFSKKSRTQSFKEIKSFIKKFFPEYPNYVTISSTWFLSPELKKVLKDDSNILDFASDFKILQYIEDPYYFFQYIFNNIDIRYGTSGHSDDFDKYGYYKQIDRITIPNNFLAKEFEKLIKDGVKLNSSEGFVEF
ncbi:MAG: hypothetical protein ACRC4M_01370, partial [Mycoplasma sp.]